ncbi:Hypothetical predicted protein [Podarcis lilfordi]|uniref:Uncharacterized protein n=1 Tax=Podarcis lilfordi TaxID=74358 RepID=A0AA35KY35_9SAUR|nr:Hypothetical predicted protein [Podarcis lilfordi]
MHVGNASNTPPPHPGLAAYYLFALKELGPAAFNKGGRVLHGFSARRQLANFKTRRRVVGSEVGARLRRLLCRLPSLPPSLPRMVKMQRPLSKNFPGTASRDSPAPAPRLSMGLVLQQQPPPPLLSLSLSSQ